MKLSEDNRRFLKQHNLTINEAISLLAEQERDANENGATLFSKNVIREGKRKDGK